MEKKSDEIDFTIVLSDGVQRPMRAPNVTMAFIRMLSYLLNVRKNVDITEIIDEANKKVYRDFEWAVIFNDGELETVGSGPEKYVEEHMIKTLEGFARHLGLSTIAANTYWHTIGKKNIK